MTNKAKIEFLKDYKIYLLSLKNGQGPLIEEQPQQRKQTCDKPKVLVLKKSLYGRNIQVG